MATLAFVLTSFAAAQDADARGRHRGHHRGHGASVYDAARHAHGRAARRNLSPVQSAANFSALVVDANTGRTLYTVNENALRHPASITKVMTLFLLFEQLEKGRLSLDTQIPVSAHAAAMAPTKLGLRAGSSIAIEDAIKAVVTKSANDMAVAIAEAIGGSEEHFAQLMTNKARALGMTRTNYANASGLPDSDQLTTAHDLVVLGRTIQERFPQYYKFFSVHAFTYRGTTMANHNHLLDRVEGMDGIKTGYTRASGFNILTSVKRGGRRIVSVVLGGRSAGHRDQIMAGLIEENLERGATTRLASAEIGSAAHRIEPASDPTPDGPVAALPAVVRAEAPKVAAVAVAAPDRPRPAVVANASRPVDDRTASIPDRKLDGSTHSVAALATATPGNPRWTTGSKPIPAKTVAAVVTKASAEVRTAKAESAYETKVVKAEAARPAATRSGVMLQIGATDEVTKANALLARARSQSSVLAAATSFTERVQKGSETLWRARFAGLSETQADNACKSLKRSGFACFATKN